jgi:hypothetical protein
VVYGADGQGWASVTGALKKGDFKDGEVTLVLERRLPAGSGASGSSAGSASSELQRGGAAG